MTNRFFYGCCSWLLSSSKEEAARSVRRVTRESTFVLPMFWPILKKLQAGEGVTYTLA
jgi:hypothetical protein